MVEIALIAGLRPNFSSDQIFSGKVSWPAPYFHEFVIEVPHPEPFLARLLERGFLGGLALNPAYRDLREHVLVCCTERNSEADLDAYAAAAAEAVKA